MPYKDPEVRKAFQRRFQAEYRKNNRERIRLLDRRWIENNKAARALVNRKHGLKRKGLSLADYDALVEKQHGRCWICRQKPNYKLCVDHCHRTNVFRGLLCRQCNAIIGRFRDDPKPAERLLFYIEQNRLFSFNGNGE